MSKTVCGSCGAVEVATIEEKGISMPGFGQTGEKPGDGMQPVEASTPARMYLPDGAGFVRKRKKAKKRRLHTLGAVPAKIMEGKSIEEFIDSDEQEIDLFLCGMDRKVYAGSEGPCAACPGGCHAEKGLPTILEVEGMAEEDFQMKVIGSGYGAQADLFVVHVERQDGRVIEAVYSGSTGEFQGSMLLSDELVDGKSLADDSVDIITTDEASDIAVKTIGGGEVLGVSADQFEGQDAWVVDMTNAEGTPVDVYVGLDGTPLGYDVYDIGLKSAVTPEEDDEDDVDEQVADAAEAPVDATAAVAAANAAEDDEEDPEAKKPKEKSLESGVSSADILAQLEELNNIAQTI